MAGGIMSVGLVGTAILVLAMNQRTDHAGREPQQHTVVVAAPPKRKPPRRQRLHQPQPRLDRTARPRPPMPNLATSLAGVSLDLAGLDPSAFDSAASTLLGDREALANLVMTDDTVDVPPQLLERATPRYPPRAQAEGVRGKVTLSFIVDAQGRVREIQVLEAVPGGVFDEAAKEAVERYRFSAGRYKGKAVNVRGRVVVRFDLG